MVKENINLKGKKMDKYNFILDQAKNIAKNVQSWADFSIKVFDQHIGLIAKNLNGLEEKKAFFDSKQFGEINQILLDLMKKFGVTEEGVSSMEKPEATPTEKTGIVELYFKAITKYGANKYADHKLMKKVEDKLNITENIDIWRRRVLYEIGSRHVENQPINYSQILLDLLLQ